MKKGYTLIETTIAILLLTICVIGFIQALNVGMLGTDKVRQSNSAMEFARSQIEYIQQQQFIVHNNSELSKYSNISDKEIPDGFAAADMNTTIYNVSGSDNRAMQQITVNVAYSSGTAHLQLVDYKAPREGAIVGGIHGGWLVSKKLNTPFLSQVFGIGWCSSPPPYWGYYYNFETGTTTSAPGPISIMWLFNQGGQWWNGVNRAYLYLYDYDFPAVKTAFPGDSGVVQRTPPTSGCISSVASGYGWGDREMAAMEMTDLPPGKYTAYFYNAGTCIILVFWSRNVPAGTATITYYK